MSDANTLTTGFLARPSAYTQPVILQRMLEALATELPALKTREENDPTVALLDACAMTLDVLSFYQQQFNQETYLNKATELFSLRELGRAINYELNPGLAANADLAFQIDSKANNTGVAVIPKGTQIQSIPSQNASLPQPFETSSDLTAYAAWNQITPYQPQVTQVQIIHGATTALWLSGVDNGLTKGDVLLLMGQYNQTNTQAAYQLIVQTVEVDTPNNRTYITWQTNWAISNNVSQDLSGNNVMLNPTDTLTAPQLSVFNLQVGSFGNNAPLVSSFPASSYYTQDNRNDWDEKHQLPLPPKDGNPSGTMPTVWQDSQATYFGTDSFSPKIYLDQSVSDIVLDSYVLLSVDGDKKLYKTKSAEEVSRADFGISGQVTQLILNDMKGNPAPEDKKFLFRTTAIYLQNKPLSLYQEIIDDDTFLISANNTYGIPLADTISPALQVGQSVIISNLLEKLSETVSWSGDVKKTPIANSVNSKFTFTLDNPPKFSYQPDTTKVIGDKMTEAANITLDLSEPKTPQFFIIATTNPIPATATSLTLTGTLLQQSEMFTIRDIGFVDTSGDATAPMIPGLVTIYPDKLENNYHPNTSVIYGNVVTATHGGTVTKEVLGSGDATQANQQFTLQKLPLTYLPTTLTNTAIPGISSTLVIKVNDVIWEEAPSLYGLTPNSKSYVLTQEDNGQVTITFGDGVQGARLPTGQENIIATYRQGMGHVGNVGSNTLILLQTRPQGVMSVTNPAPASGGVDAESFTSSRQNIPSGVLTMDRLVSQTDFENYARTQTSIGKSRADFLSQANGQPLLFITVSGPHGTAIDSQYVDTLLCSISQVSNLGQNVAICSYTSLEFNVAAILTIAADAQAPVVVEQVTQALLTRYGFDQQEFAQPVIAGDVIETIRQVSGVVAVDIKNLYQVGKDPLMNNILYASPAKLDLNNPPNKDDCNGISPAELLTINPTPNIGIVLTTISATVSSC